MRLQLAGIAEHAFRTFKFVGGPAPRGKKLAWRNKVLKQAKALKATLTNSEDFHQTRTKRSKASNSVTFVPSSKITNQVNSTLEDLNKLIVQIDFEEPPEEQGPTFHSNYLQFVVDGMTEVFIHFRGRADVKRNVFGEHVDGEFPEFIRAAAAPCLNAYYNGFASNPKSPKKLNAQIQEAVRKYSNFKAE